MNYFNLIFVTFILFTFTSKANDVQIIELHQNKSLDQLVLEKENNLDEEDDDIVTNIENYLYLCVQPKLLILNF